LPPVYVKDATVTSWEEINTETPPIPRLQEAHQLLVYDLRRPCAIGLL